MKIGIDLGGSHIAVGNVQNGKIIEKRETKITEYDRKNITEFIEENILKYVQEISNGETIESIGIAVPGTVTENKIVKCVNLEIENYNIVEKLKSELYKRYDIQNIKIKIANDAKCAAIAESEYGCIAGYNDAIFLTLGTGIGGAAIINNKLLKSKDVPGYEFGHMTINSSSNEQCKCGKFGCFEQYASMKVFKNNLRKEMELTEYASGNQLYDLLKYDKVLNRNDEKIRKVITEFVKNLALGISNLINIFEPEVIGIGGSYIYFEEFLNEKLKEELKNQNLLFNQRNDIIIKPAILGNEAGIVGASILAQKD